MNPIFRHALAAFLLLTAVLAVTGLGWTIWLYPHQTFWIGVAIISSIVAAISIFVAYRFIYKALEGIKISRSR